MESVHLLGEKRALFAILTRPQPLPAADTPAVIVLNAGLQHRVGPFRLSVQLARRIAEHGFAVLRIDQSGKGDSDRRRGLTFLESIKHDFREAAEFLRATVGANRFVLLGLCSGADDALYVASSEADVCGVVLLDVYAPRTYRYYWTHYARRLFQGRHWLSFARRCFSLLWRVLVRRDRPSAQHKSTELMEFQEPLAAEEIRRRFVAASRHACKFLCVFTSGVEDYYNHGGQLTDWLANSIDTRCMSEIFMRGSAHTYPLLKHRAELFDRLCEWMEAEFGGATTSTRTALSKPRVAGGPSNDSGQMVSVGR